MTLITEHLASKIITLATKFINHTGNLAPYFFFFKSSVMVVAMDTATNSVILVNVAFTW